MNTAPCSVWHAEERGCPTIAFVYRFAAAIGADPVWDILYVIEDVADVQIGDLRTRASLPPLVTDAESDVVDFDGNDGPSVWSRLTRRSG